MGIPSIVGFQTWSLSRDEEGHREYKLRSKIKMAQPGLDGPGMALRTPGLPLPGSWWIVDNDVDLWAWCRPTASVQPFQQNEGEPVQYFIVENTFSTKPPNWKEQRCQDQEITDPLLEPPRISGDGVKYTEEATKDRFGNPINNSAWEQLRGPQVEFDRNRATIKIIQNVATIEQAYLLPAQFADCVNTSPIWGAPYRSVKLSNYKWERRFYGQCYVYYNRELTFDINTKVDPETGQVVSGYDRDLLDEGTQALNGHWDSTTGGSGNWILDNIGGQPPSRFNPAHFVRLKDKNGENIKRVLDGFGKPITVKVMGLVENVSGTLSAAGAAIVINSTAHGLADNDTVSVNQTRAVAELVEQTDAFPCRANGVWKIVVLDANRFYLFGSDGKGQFWNPNGPFGFWILLKKADGSLLTGGKIHVEKYNEADFLQLGVPTIF